MKINFLKIILLGAAISLLPISCTPDRADGDGNGLTPQSNLDASFTVIEESPNNYLLKAMSNNYMLHRWNIDNTAFLNGSNEKRVSFYDEGTYEIMHQAIGQGGVVASQSSQTITVPVSDPVKGNLVKGGKFLNSDDWSKWTINNTGAGAQWTFTEGWATLTATGWAGQGVYQAIEVVKDRKYKIDMIAKSASGCTDTWFEVYCGYNVPVPGQDYNGDGTVYRSINTWDGSGKDAFNDWISEIGKVNPEKNGGIFTATQTGTVYLGIRGGGADMKDGISINKVEFRGVN